jgi:lysophospholipase L1-like esterase
MVRRLATVDTDNGSLLPAFNVPEESLPERLRPESLSAIFGGSQTTAKKQSILLAEAMRSLRKGEAIKLVVRGDSTTYGHDTVSSDKVAAPVGTLPDGSSHSFTRSPKPYPAALQDYLNLGRGVSNVTVENQGYSGDHVYRGYTRWTANVGAKLTVISYGINDAQASYVPEDKRGNLTAYLDDIEQMLLRDLEWGSAVVFLTPTRQLGQAGNVDIDSYRNALQSLASRYGIPVIDGEQFMATSPRDAWSDGNHLTTKGNAIMGARLAAVFLAESPLSPTSVDDGTKLLTRPTLDGFTKTGEATYSSSSGYPTPQDPSVGSGSAISLGAGTGLWAFYAETPDLIVFPSSYLAGSTGETGASITYELDFGVDTGDNYNDRAVDLSGPVFGSSASSVVHGPVTGTATSYNATIKDSAPIVLRIPTAGWHTIRAIGARSTTSLLAVHSLTFYAYQTYDNARKARTAQTDATAAIAAGVIKGSYLKVDPASYNETTNPDILNTKVYWPDVAAAVYGHTYNADYYKHPPMRLTVTSYDGAVMEYLFLASVRSDVAGADVTPMAVDAPTSSGSSKINIIKLIRTTQLHSNAPGVNVNARVLESIQFVGASRELQLNWKATLDDGTTPRNMKKNFNVAFTVY